MIIFQHRVLSRFNVTSICLRIIEIVMVTCISMLQSLITFVDELQKKVDTIEDETKPLSL